MRRRAVLTGLGASVGPLTGCIGRGSLTNNLRMVRISPSGLWSPVDDLPDDSPLEPSVEVIRAKVTADQTAGIRVSVTNTTDQPAWNRTVATPVFSSFITEDGPQDQRLVLGKPDWDISTVSSDCYRLSPTTHLQGPDVATDIRYNPGETKTTAFDLYGHPENTGPCLAPGNYHIRSGYRIADVVNAAAATWEFEWGFTITVRESYY